MMSSPLGIGIPKLKSDACLVRPSGKLRHRAFPDSPLGFAQLSAWLEQHGAGQVHACLEATGAYGDGLATYLHDAGHAVKYNPYVKDLGERRGRGCGPPSGSEAIPATEPTVRRGGGMTHPTPDSTFGIAA